MKKIIILIFTIISTYALNAQVQKVEELRTDSIEGWSNGVRTKIININDTLKFSDGTKLWTNNLSSLGDSSVLFTDSNGVISTDEGHFIYDKSLRSLFLGGNPLTEGHDSKHVLEIVNDSAVQQGILQSTTYGFNNCFAHWRAARGSKLFPKALQAGDIIHVNGYRGYTGTQFGGSVATMYIYARENFTPTSQGTYIAFQATPLGGQNINRTNTLTMNTDTSRFYTDLTIDRTLSVGTSVANSSAMLTVESTTKGFLMPRMTTTQRLAISNPTIGLQVFDTDINSIVYFTGENWFSQ